MFFRAVDKDNVRGVTYAFNQNRYSKAATKFISIYTGYIIEGYKNVTYQILESAEYLELKNQAKQYGFVFSKTTSSDSTAVLTYKKDNFELSLVSIHNRDDQGRYSSGYEISLTEVPN